MSPLQKQVAETTGAVSNVMIVTVAVVFCFTLSIIAGLVYVGRDVTQIFYFIGATLPAAVASLAALRKTEQVNAKMDVVAQAVDNTNGNGAPNGA